MNTSVCSVCGKAFQTAGRYAKFCPECRVERDRELAQERKTKKAMREIKRPSVSLSEANRAAKAAGLSYGQWVVRGMPGGADDLHQ